MQDLEQKIRKFCLQFRIKPDPLLKEDIRSVYNLFMYMAEHETAMRDMSILVKQQNGFYGAVDKTKAHLICRRMRAAYKKYRPVEASMIIGATLPEHCSAGHIVMLQRLWSSAPVKIAKAIADSYNQQVEYKLAA